MTKHTAVLIIGVLLAAVPFSGLPHTWDSLITLLAGLALILTGWLLRAERVKIEQAFMAIMKREPPKTRTQLDVVGQRRSSRINVHKETESDLAKKIYPLTKALEGLHENPPHDTTLITPNS